MESSIEHRVFLYRELWHSLCQSVPRRGIYGLGVEGDGGRSFVVDADIANTT